MLIFKLTRRVLVIAVGLTVYSIVLLTMLFPWALVALGIGVLIGACKKGYRLTAYGTSRWAGILNLPRAPNGFLIGQLESSRPSIMGAALGLLNPRVDAKAACQDVLSLLRKKQQELVRIAITHIAIFAPTGAGKGVSCVIPHLLSNPESTVVVDPKGENARLTVAARRNMGHTVVILDPFRVVTQTPDSFNPIDFIEDTTLAIDECRDLAESLVVRTGQEKEPHWNDGAELFILAASGLVHQCAEGEDRSLQGVRSLLADQKKLAAGIELMCQSTAWDGMLSRIGNQLKNYVDKELGSTLTTTNRHLRFLDTLAIAESTKSSSFDPSLLRQGRMTVYLVLPPEHMRAQSALLRMWISSLLRAVVRCGLGESSKVHFVLDEAAALGHMESIDDALNQYRGYGVRLQLYYQSLGQLKRCWPEGQDQTLLANTTQMYFAVSDNETAKYVSDRAGEATEVVTSGGSSYGTSCSSGQQGSTSTSYSHNENHNWQQLGRKLLKPEEVMTLSERVAITFIPGCYPVWTTLVRYYETSVKGSGWFWPAVRALAESVALLIAAGLLALALTHIASDRGVMPGLQDESFPAGDWIHDGF